MGGWENIPSTHSAFVCMSSYLGWFCGKINPNLNELEQ